MSLRIIPLASSSAANCTAVVAGDQVLIVDAGLKRTEIITRLCDLDILSLEKPVPDALLLTHEHHDHSHYHMEWQRVGAPIYMTIGTARQLGYTSYTYFTKVEPWEPRTLPGGIVVTPILVPHDASEPVAYRIAFGGEVAIVATDLGMFPTGWDLFTAGATEMLVEANYHPALLASCDYRDSLKRRIAGNKGHMNILDCAMWLRESLPVTVRRLFLGHISRKACDPKIVRHMASLALDGRADVELIVVES